ncbi:MAG: alpha/beta fold hydrolase [Polyangiaceae bacterium]
MGESQDWPSSDHPRRAAVSSFGIGGTNAHVVLEEHLQPRNDYDVHESSPTVLQLSARSAPALDRYTAKLATWFTEQITGDVAPYPLTDVAVTLRERRKQFEERRAIRVSSFADAAHKLGDSSEWVTGNVVEGNPELAFVFPGQGSLMPNRLHGLVAGDVSFAERLRAHSALASDLLHFDLMGWYESADADPELMADNAKAQLAVLCLSMAMTDTLSAKGLRPSVLLGHSLGEWTAAYAGGILTAEDTVRAVYHRGTLMQRTPSGRAIIVRASADVLRPHLPEDVTLACDNAQELCLLSGEPEPIEAFQAKLDDLGIGHQPTPIRVAVHSPLMDSCVEPFCAELAKLSFRAPQIPIVSAVTGEWLRPEDATSPDFWSAQLRACVNFRAAAKTLLRRSPLIGIELGMGTALTALLRTQITEAKRHRCLAILPTGRAASVRDGDLLERVPLQLWTQGYEIDFSGGRTQRVTTPVLPAYPFERNRYWVDAPQASPEAAVAAAPQTNTKVRGGSTYPPDATTSVSERLKRVLSKVSGLPTTKIATDVPFSAQGIESLILVLFAEQLNELFGLSLGYARLIECNTLDKLAAAIGDSLVVEEAPKSVRPPPSMRKDLGGFTGLVCMHDGDRRLPFLFVHGDRGVDLLNQVLPKEQPVYAYAHQGSDGEPIRYSTVESLAERCAKEWTRAIGNRPCVLAGHSYGGIVAYHLAYLLRELGQAVPLLLLVDSMHPRVFRNDERPGLLWLKREISQRKRRFPYDLAYAKARAALAINRKVPVDLRTDYILGAYERAVPNYEPPPVDVDVVLYRATINMSGHPTNGWDEKRLRSLVVRDVEGSHFERGARRTHFRDDRERHLPSSCGIAREIRSRQPLNAPISERDGMKLVPSDRLLCPTEMAEVRHLGIAVGPYLGESALMSRVIVLFGVIALGCQASANAQVSAAGPNDVTTDGNIEFEGTNSTGETSPQRVDQQRKTAPVPTVSSTPQGTDDAVVSDAPKALFGARAGLHLASPIPATCRCLAVAVGQPNDPRFAWDGQPSSIDPNTQLAVALGSDGIECPTAPESTRGASYHGYSIAGLDVVVSVESAQSGRPLTRGAIIPKPPEGGRLVVSPVDARTPFGRALDGSANVCVVSIESSTEARARSR